MTTFFAAVASLLPGLVPGFYLLSFALGAVIGISELISRYKDAPLRALLTMPALLYVGLNGAASLGALALVRQMGWMDTVGGGNPASQIVLQSLAAGFSAMALFRTALFTIRVGNADIGVGPAAFLQILLSAADRACDRTRARPRAIAVQQIMSGVSFVRAKQALPSLCFGLMQNVGVEEQRSFSTVVAQLDAAEMEDSFKANSLGLALMNVVGESVLRQAVTMLREDISAPPRQIVQSIATLQMLRTTRFDSAQQALDACLFLVNRMADAALRAQIEADIARIGRMTVTDRQKVLYLSAVLIGRFGEGVVQTVLRVLPENDPNAAAAPPPPA